MQPPFFYNLTDEFTSMRNGIFYLLLGLLIESFCFNGLAQNRCIEGEILDEETGFPISDVHIYCPLSDRGTVTNDKGAFKICGILENVLLEINHLAYSSRVIYVSDSTRAFISLSLKEKGVMTNEVIIKGISGNLSKDMMPGRGKLSSLDIIQLPSFLGQPDVVRSLQTMAGVQTVSEGVGDIFVRGGSPGQNLILLDGMELMNPVHLMGIYSIFNPFTTHSVDLFKGHAPASLGSRLSSVISVSSTEPTIVPSGFSGSIGNVATSLGLTQKSQDGKWGIVMGLRRSFLELYKPITSLFLSAEDDFFKSNSYYFYDFNGRLVYQPKATTSFALNWYQGKDFFKMKNQKINYFTETDFGNGVVSFVWNQSITKRVKLMCEVGYTQAWAGFSGMIIDNDIGFNSNHRKLYTGIQLSGENNRHSWSVGSKISRYSTLPQDMFLIMESDTSTFYNKFENAQAELFLEDSYRLTEKLVLYGGLRTHFYKTLGPYDFVGSNESSTLIKKGDSSLADFHFSPSISMQYRMGAKDQMKLAWSRNVQMIHVASISSMPLPNDMWMMATPHLKPQTGHQFSLGYYKQLEGFSFSSELFAKYLFHQSVFNINLEGDEKSFENHFFIGKGRVFGLEITARKELGTIRGELNYTLMRSERSFPEIYEGEWYSDKFDRTHDLSVTTQWKINERWDLSAFFVYATGNNMTLPSGRMWLMGTVMNDYDGYNNFRMPPYHRLDLSVNYHLKSDFFAESVLNFSLVNLYNRPNPYFLYFKVFQGSSRYDLDVQAAQVSLFPILPSISWRFKF